MKILHLSDTHGMHRKLTNLPTANVIVHSGDFTWGGTDNEALDFAEWFCDLDFPHKIFIAGNHDDCLFTRNIDGLDNNVHYLCNSGIEIDGVKFYGVPLFTQEDLYGLNPHKYAAIPEDTDVVITHCPPLGILDLDDAIGGKFINYGNREVLDRIRHIRPQAHLFGHVHRQHGITRRNGIIFSNGAIMNDDYTKLNTPNIIEL